MQGKVADLGWTFCGPALVIWVHCGAEFVSLTCNAYRVFVDAASAVVVMEQKPLAVLTSMVRCNNDSAVGTSFTLTFATWFPFITKSL